MEKKMPVIQIQSTTDVKDRRGNCQRKAQIIGKFHLARLTCYQLISGSLYRRQYIKYVWCPVFEIFHARQWKRKSQQFYRGKKKKKYWKWDVGLSTLLNFWNHRQTTTENVFADHWAMDPSSTADDTDDRYAGNCGWEPIAGQMHQSRHNAVSGAASTPAVPAASSADSVRSICPRLWRINKRPTQFWFASLRSTSVLCCLHIVCLSVGWPKDPTAKKANQKKKKWEKREGYVKTCFAVLAHVNEQQT